MSKKYYLSVDQRRTIINALLKAKEASTEKKMTDKTTSIILQEVVEAENQDRDMLANLFKIEEFEE